MLYVGVRDDIRTWLPGNDQSNLETDHRKVTNHCDMLTTILLYIRITYVYVYIRTYVHMYV